MKGRFITRGHELRRPTFDALTFRASSLQRLRPQRGQQFHIHLWLSCLSIHTHTHTSIFKHAASAWRHDTTTSEPKYIEGHSEIASGHMRWSRFLLLLPLHPPFTCSAPTKTLFMTISDLLNAFPCVRGRLLLLRVPACAGQEDRARAVWREHQRGS